MTNKNSLVRSTVKIKDQDPVHENFRNKLGEVLVDDPNDDTVTVYLQSGGCVECHRENLIRI